MFYLQTENRSHIAACKNYPSRRYLLMVFFLHNKFNFSTINNFSINLRCKNNPVECGKNKFWLTKRQVSYCKRASNHLKWKIFSILFGRQFLLQLHHWKPGKWLGSIKLSHQPSQQTSCGMFLNSLFFSYWPDWQVEWDKLSFWFCTNGLSWRLHACNQVPTIALSRQS